jgi:hypothetical protein
MTATVPRGPLWSCGFARAKNPFLLTVPLADAVGIVTAVPLCKQPSM